MLNYGGCWIAIKACSANVKTEGLSELLTASTASVHDGSDDTEEKEIRFKGRYESCSIFRLVSIGLVQRSLNTQTETRSLNELLSDHMKEDESEHESCIEGKSVDLPHKDVDGRASILNTSISTSRSRAHCVGQRERTCVRCCDDYTYAVYTRPLRLRSRWSKHSKRSG